MNLTNATVLSPRIKLRSFPKKIEKPEASYHFSLLTVMKAQCTECNKKLSLIQETSNKCRCNNLYCDSHKFPEDHKCSYDYITSAKQELIIKNPLITSTKIVPI